MNLLSIEDVLVIHEIAIKTSGGSFGLRDRRLLESCVAQPSMTFDGNDLYPTLADKAAAIGHALIANHPFVDGNKRIGHACIEATLMLNDCELTADVDDAENTILAVASGDLDRDALTRWVHDHLTPLAG